MTDSGKWQVLIVDDEESVHSVTKLALTGFSYKGRGIEFTHAYSGAEAREAMQSGKEFAVMLLDVVMETDDAGLQVCNFIRNELKERKVRILLRTGNPGHAPEQEVIMNYEINDYIEKTDLTMGRLINHMVVALRAYRDLWALENAREGYRELVDATGELVANNVPMEFVHGALRQLAALLYLEMKPEHPFWFAMVRGGSEKVELVTGLGLARNVETHLENLPDQQRERLQDALKSGTAVSGNGYHISYARMDSGTIYLLFIAGSGDAISLEDKGLADIFCARIGRFFEQQQEPQSSR